MRLCGAAFGGLTAWDGNYANVVAMQGFPPALAEYMVAREPGLAVSPVIAQLSKTKRPQQLQDVMAGEGYRNGHPDSRAVADARLIFALAIEIGRDRRRSEVDIFAENGVSQVGKMPRDRSLSELGLLDFNIGADFDVILEHSAVTNMREGPDTAIRADCDRS